MMLKKSEEKWDTLRDLKIGYVSPPASLRSAFGSTLRSRYASASVGDGWRRLSHWAKARDNKVLAKSLLNGHFIPLI